MLNPLADSEFNDCPPRCTSLEFRSLVFIWENPIYLRGHYFPFITYPGWLKPTGFWLFLAGAGVMVILHLVAWFKTLSELFSAEEKN